MCRYHLLFIAILMGITTMAQEAPLKLGVVGLTHGHVGWILDRDSADDINMAGIVETDTALIDRLSQQFGFSKDLVYPTITAMIKAVSPDAVAAFGTIKEHLAVVEACAPEGIHVMLEKPMALDFKEAQKMAELAKKHGIEVLTNYETSWYPTNKKAYDLFKEGKVGPLRKVIVRDGHKGPKKIGVPEEFLEWLVDPEHNGGGALMDFGCYGANLMTWLQNGQRPLQVTAVTQQLQPANNPLVDDDATIIVNYPSAMAIFEPSWNWPIGRKDMEIYGENGALLVDNASQLRIRISEVYDGFSEELVTLQKRLAPFDDPFSVFASVIRGTLQLEPFDPYSLENNLITMEILSAAKKSARTQRTIVLKNEH